jgi:hypothetical protein
MRGGIQLRLLLHAQQRELHLLQAGVAQVPRFQRGGSGGVTYSLTNQLRYTNYFLSLSARVFDDSPTAATVNVKLYSQIAKIDSKLLVN